MNYKFKIGDKVKFMGDGHYNFKRHLAPPAKEGDTFIISSRGISVHGGGNIYSVKGSYYEDRAN